MLLNMKEEYKVGDWVKLVSERPDEWNQDGLMDKYLGKVVQVTDILGNRLVFDKMDGWGFSVNDIERHALPTEINIHSKEKPDIFKHIKVNHLLDEMIKADKELYVKILDTPGFANAFGELVNLALQ